MLPFTNAMLMTGFGGSGIVNAPFSDVVLLCGFEGSDGSTTFTDESTAANSGTFVGTAQIDTAQFKFGSSSYYQTTTSTSAITIPNSANFAFGAGDFTIEAWVRFES